MARAQITDNSGDYKEFPSGIYKAYVMDLELKYIKENDNDPDHLFKFTIKVPEHDPREYFLNLWVDLKLNSSGQLPADNNQIARLFNFLDAIDYAGGYNPKGEWENPAGEVIPEEGIQDDIMNHCYKSAGQPHLIVCIHKQLNKKDGRTYQRIAWQCFPLTQDGANAAHKKYDKIVAKDNSETPETPSTTSPATNTPPKPQIRI